MCQEGYSGSTCSYTHSEFIALTAQISHEISNLEASVGSVPDREIMTNLVLMTRSPEVISLDSANSTMQILDTIINQNNSSQVREDALGVLSHLSSLA